MYVAAAKLNQNAAPRITDSLPGNPWQLNRFCFLFSLPATPVLFDFSASPAKTLGFRHCPRRGAGRQFWRVAVSVFPGVTRGSYCLQECLGV